MVCMLGGITVVDDDIIDYMPEPRKSSEGFIHSAVVVLGYRRDSIWCLEELESPKRCDECRQ